MAHLPADDTLRQQYAALTTHVMDMDIPSRLRAAMMDETMVLAGEALRLNEQQWLAKKAVGPGALMALNHFFQEAGLRLSASGEHPLAPEKEAIQLRSHFSKALGLPVPRRRPHVGMIDRMVHRHFPSFGNVYGEPYALHFFVNWPEMVNAAAKLHHATLDSGRVRELLDIRDNSPNEFRHFQSRELVRLAANARPPSLGQAMDHVVHVAQKMRAITVARDVRNFELSYGLPASKP